MFLLTSFSLRYFSSETENNSTVKKKRRRRKHQKLYKGDFTLPTKLSVGTSQKTKNFFYMTQQSQKQARGSRKGLVFRAIKLGRYLGSARTLSERPAQSTTRRWLSMVPKNSITRKPSWRNRRILSRFRRRSRGTVYVPRSWRSPQSTLLKSRSARTNFGLRRKVSHLHRRVHAQVRRGVRRNSYLKLFSVKHSSSSRALVHSVPDKFALKFSKSKKLNEVGLCDTVFHGSILYARGFSQSLFSRFNSLHQITQPVIGSYFNNTLLGLRTLALSTSSLNDKYTRTILPLLHQSTPLLTCLDSVDRGTTTFTSQTSLGLAGAPVSSIPRLQNWLLELLYTRARYLNSPNAIFVLARAPYYRMSLKSNVPVSTSQYYLNLYRQSAQTKTYASSFLQRSLFSKSYLGVTKARFLRPTLRRLNYAQISDFTTTVKSFARVKTISEYSSLLSVRPLINTATDSLSTSLRTKARKRRESRHTLKRSRVSEIQKLLNIKTVHLRRARKRKQRNPRGSSSSSLTKRVFIKRNRRVRFIRRLTRTLRRRIRRLWKKLRNRIKWKSRRFVYFSRKLSRISKNRRKELKSSRLHTYTNTNLLKKRAYFPLKTSQSSASTFAVVYNAFTHSLSKSTTNHLFVSGKAFNYLITNTSLLWTSFLNPFLLKSIFIRSNAQPSWRTLRLLIHKNQGSLSTHSVFRTNLAPHESFQKTLSKNVLNSLANQRFREDVIPFYQNTLIRFIEFCTGRRAIFQFYPFVNQHVGKDYMVRYHRWLPRMSFYERRLGHRFFLEEALHILHLGFILRDPKIIASWLKAIILRISFWKTRSIFRFLKYLFNNYFIHVFDDVKIKGMKIRLKGKISAAGNSRKRTILFRIGRTSHAEVNLRVLKDFSLINTFTGVMGFQVYLFY